ncbi:putative galacturonosyltransferase 6 [Acorus calamus]|uniref:Hexosyltransferase n=1 Tax=Acorus calamus TaxID=4465 RepID=A0AAV9EDJ0_ACOCL|nr:putative galacturonosyltransferase 6 [Acorus calamus]
MKKRSIRWQRTLFLCLLSLSVVAPIVFFSYSFPNSLDRKSFADGVGSTTHSVDALLLKQEAGESLKEPDRIVYSVGDDGVNDTENGFSADSDEIRLQNSLSIGGEKEFGEGLEEPDGGDDSSVDDTGNGLGADSDVGDEIRLQKISTTGGGKEQPDQTTVRKQPDGNGYSQVRQVDDVIVREMKDDLIMAKAYLNFAPPNSNSHLVKELKMRIKEVERVVGQTSKDSKLSKIAMHRKRAMKATLAKASKVYPDCSAMSTKLRAMAYNSEEQLRSQMNEVSFLTQLAARAFPKGLHCLSMRLTSEYFSLQPEEQALPNRHKVQQPDLYHYAIFSDNILACQVVVNSTVITSMEPEKIVFHVVTDGLNYPAMVMWFLLNPPGDATIHIENIDDFKWLPSLFDSSLKQPFSQDPRFSSTLNHLRFYLPQVFPSLNKILLLDHDVVVQRDLRRLWEVDMEGKVNGAVETCRSGDSFHQLDMYVNFAEPIIAKSFDPKACTWAFGMNMFDLKEWRRQNLTAIYHKWLQMGKIKQLMNAGTLPVGQLTFYNQTVALDRQWHVLGLGSDPTMSRGEIERAPVIHYNGKMKPWLELGIPRYKGYWNRFLNYNHPFLQQCNVHE